MVLSYFFLYLLSIRPTSCCSVRSVAEDEIEAMKDKLNVIDIDQVLERLR